MIALELWSYTFRDAPLVELARAGGRAGFAHVTTTVGQFVASGGAAAGLRARIEDAGVTVSFIDGLCSALPGVPASRGPDDPHAATLVDCIEAAHALGAGAINLVHMGGVPTPVEQLAEAFARACRRAREEGLRLAIEFLPGTGIPDLRTAVAIVRAAGAENGSVLLDTWHFARSGETLEELDPATAMLIGGLQLADRSPDQDLLPYVPMRGRKLPGAGALPLREIVARVLAARPGLPVGAEVLSDEMDALGPEAGAGRLAEACRSCLP
ncbi:sugar phosphate isomerase/epimerase family protein [uncultured Sphingomonas sp.]|uniref:sugar phosphate isomerase/epimerase family protein n=1 Tax=uncultured Sphingomonas sp. TaxID=158754 RepID=UPI0035C9E864